MNAIKYFIVSMIGLLSFSGMAQTMIPLTFEEPGKTISPLDYGLREATSGIERYNAIYKAHTESVTYHWKISYRGIDTLNIELPTDYKSIPLGYYTDFDGLVLNITNHTRHGALFCMLGTEEKVELTKEKVDNLNYRDIDELAHEDKLLILTDKHPWTERQGYGYKVFRKDIIWVHNGQGMNAPIAPWNSDSTELCATYTDIDTSLKIIRNLTLHRTAESTFKTYFVTLKGQFNVLIENISVTTPKSKMIDDQMFGIYNCARITLRNIKINGTYSGYGKWRDFGYAFSMSNTWDTHFDHVVADGNWGVFGTNNMSHTFLTDCDINRFDIHCYGRDVLLQRCILKQRQTQFSSMYGTVTFDSCSFIDCIPVRIRSSYNAYTPFDIEVHNCTFELTSRYHSLVNVMLLDTAVNSRPELREKCWPNLEINNLQVIAPKKIKYLNLYLPSGTMSELQKPIGYLSQVIAHGIKIQHPDGSPSQLQVRLTSHEFKTINKLTYIIE